MKSSSIWVDKYRPKTISDVIFQDERQAQKFQSFVKEKDFPNLLLSGVQGTGKTTVSRALIRDIGIEKFDVLLIKCSEKQIAAIREEVLGFAMTMPIGQFKVVRLEECDYLSLDAQALLRTTIEDSSRNCRFIATCNYENKLIPPLKSRFQQFYFRAPDKEQMALRMAGILETEGVDFDAEDLLTYIDVGYPDIRKTIQLLQGNTSDKKLLSPSNASTAQSDWKFGLLDAISSGDFKKARTIVCETATREEHEDVYRFLYDNISKLKVDDKDAAILTIAEHLFKHGVVSDTEINLAALFISLSKL